MIANHKASIHQEIPDTRMRGEGYHHLDDESYSDRSGIGQFESRYATTKNIEEIKKSRYATTNTRAWTNSRTTQNNYPYKIINEEELGIEILYERMDRQTGSDGTLMEH